YADDDERLPFECLLETCERRKRVETIDAAARPKIDDEHATFELFERERMIDVEPRGRALEARCRGPFALLGQRRQLNRVRGACGPWARRDLCVGTRGPCRMAVTRGKKSE